MGLSEGSVLMGLPVVCWSSLNIWGGQEREGSGLCVYMCVRSWGADRKSVTNRHLFIFLSLFSFQWCPDRGQIFP